MARLMLSQIFLLILVGSLQTGCTVQGSCSTSPKAEKPKPPTTFQECVDNNGKIMHLCDNGECKSGDQPCRKRCAERNSLYPPVNCVDKFGLPGEKVSQ